MGRFRFPVQAGARADRSFAPAPDDEQKDSASGGGRLLGHLEAGALARPAERIGSRPKRSSDGGRGRRSSSTKCARSGRRATVDAHDPDVAEALAPRAQGGKASGQCAVFALELVILLGATMRAHPPKQVFAHDPWRVHQHDRRGGGSRTVRFKLEAHVVPDTAFNLLKRISKPSGMSTGRRGTGTASAHRTWSMSNARTRTPQP